MHNTERAGPAVQPAGSVTTPRGWRAAAVACGMRNSGRDDLALLLSDTPCAAAALFTTNRVKSAHIHYDSALMQRNPAGIQAVAINSVSANACTGEAGIAAAATMARAVERELGLPADSAFVMSTGVIGVPLNTDKIVAGIAQGAPRLAAEHGPAAAGAIMTTDTRPKHCAVQLELPDGGTVAIGGIAKGSGMIHPNMATMLGIVTTDASCSPAVLDAALRAANARSFNCISVDGDTSTNDTLLALANGQANQPPITDLDSPAGQCFVAGLTRVCQYLAQAVVRDGEGARRFITITVQGAASDDDAHRAAMSIARSPLVKTAINGADPNWGRVMCALGYSGAAFVPEDVQLSFGPIKAFADGLPLAFDEQAAHDLLDTPEVDIHVDLGAGSSSAVAWTCDFSYEYVRINAEYRT